MSTLAQRFVECMARVPHLRPVDVARLAKVSAPSVSDWIHGNTKTIKKPQAAQRLADVFGCDRDWLSDGLGAPNWRDPATARVNETPVAQGLSLRPFDTPPTLS
jgi:transcriptional regulator with XRE-family HTH domain